MEKRKGFKFWNNITSWTNLHRCQISVEPRHRVQGDRRQTHFEYRHAGDSPRLRFQGEEEQKLRLEHI
jgi:hypothetical protein